MFNICYKNLQIIHLIHYFSCQILFINFNQIIYNIIHLWVQSCTLIRHIIEHMHIILLSTHLGTHPSYLIFDGIAMENCLFCISHNLLLRIHRSLSWSWVVAILFLNYFLLLTTHNLNLLCILHQIHCSIIFAFIFMLWDKIFLVVSPGREMHASLQQFLVEFKVDWLLTTRREREKHRPRPNAIQS